MPAPSPFLFVAVALGIAVAAYVILIGAARILRNAQKVRFGRAYHAFAASAALLAGVHASVRLTGLEPAWLEPGRQHLTALTVLLSAFPIVTIINRILWVRKGASGRLVEAPRVLADTTGLVVFIAIALVMVQFVYSVKVPGLVAGSGVVAIILGLAMQDLLGNIFGGLAIHLEKPFKPGDWLLVEGQDAQVVEITWRSTRLITNDDVMLDVPNATIVKNTIVNYEKPTAKHALRMLIGLHYDVPPSRAQQALREAATSVPGVSDSPAPVVLIRDFTDTSVTYDIKFWIDDHRFAQRILSEVRTHAWYAVRRAGMDIPFPIVNLGGGKNAGSFADARSAAVRALRSDKIFSFLDDAQFERLVQESRLVMFAPQEHITTQGATGDSMFVIVKGRAEVRIVHDGRSDVVAKFGPGDCFGEMSLLTGEPRTATVVALDEIEAIEITRRVLTPLVQQAPDVLHRLSELLAERQAANQRLSAGAVPGDEKKARAETMLHRLRGFFYLES